MAGVDVPGILDDIPIAALRTSTREIISTLLNPQKVLPTEDGLPRDWRGLAQLTGLNSQMVVLLGSKPDPTGQVLSQWKQGTVGCFRSFLGQLDRWDVVDDTVEMMENDVSQFLKRKEETKSSASELDAEIDKQILTVDDVYRLEQGLQPQHYDAFLLFAEEDQDFATQIVDRMENDYGLKLCLRDRDLVGGLTFEHEAIMRLIAKRCNRLIVIASPNFVKSEANKFFVTFATALGIDQRLRKVVPVIYQRCELPPELTYYFCLVYNRAGKLYDFWTKLHDSIQSANSLPSPRTELPAIKANGEYGLKSRNTVEQTKIVSTKFMDEDTCSLENKTSYKKINLFEERLTNNHKSLSMESLKTKINPSKFVRKLLSKKKKQLAEAT